MTTRERILMESLNLFSEKGYEGVSMRDIATAVSIKAASIYNHFRGKDDIIEALLEEMKARYDIEASKMLNSGSQAEEDVSVYTQIDENTLVQMGKSLFLYFLHDEYLLKFRRMLTMEQFRSEKFRDVFEKQYYLDPIEYQSKLFEGLMNQGVFIQSDGKVMAIHFYAPIYMFLAECDRNPSKETEVLEMLEAHIRQFAAIYGKSR